ncbi:MAG: Gx transporter family protein [Desulfomonilaceae bacterium]|jgi:heptaprenyl diphosphate synthase
MSDRTQKLSQLAMLLALATAIHSLEALVPFTVGWFRFGFANIIGLATLYIFGFKDAALLTIGRILLGGLISGQFGSPGFFLAAAGGISSICVMAVAYHFGERFLSEVGVSVLGAVTHNMAQLWVAYAMLVKNESILLLAPIMIFAAIVTGIMNGLAAKFLIKRMKSLGF